MTLFFLLWAAALWVFFTFPSWPLAALLLSPLAALPLWRLMRRVASCPDAVATAGAQPSPRDR